MAKHILDIAFSASLLVGSIHLWFVADRFPHFPRYRDVDSDFWPKALMILIAVLAAVLLFQNLQALRLHREKRRVGANDAEKAPESELGWTKLLFAAGLTVAYVLALRYAGFLVSTVIFLAIAQNIVFYRNTMMKVIFPVALTAVLAVLFVGVMAIPLPRGAGMFYELSLYFY